MLFSRPTNSCDTMCGNTMMSRSGNAGSGRRGTAGLSFSFLKNILLAFSVRSADAGLMVLLVDDERRIAFGDHVLVQNDLFDAVFRRNVVHDVEHRLFEDRAQTARTALAFERLLGDRLERTLGELELHRVHLE